jgi:hypothetical protein
VDHQQSFSGRLCGAGFSSGGWHHTLLTDIPVIVFLRDFIVSHISQILKSGKMTELSIFGKQQ